jgi:protein SCO1
MKVISAMNKAFFAAILLGVLAAAGCDQNAAEKPPLAGARMGGAFSLVNQDGKTVTDRDFAGKYRLIYFGYTYCPDVCPVDVQRLMQGLSAFEKADKAAAEKLQPIFITVDPQRDTPTVVKQFVTAFHPRLIGLTGTDAQIAAVAKKYAAVYQKGEGSSKDAYLVDHSRTAVLYGPDGSPIALIPQDDTAAAIARELARWVR